MSGYKMWKNTQEIFQKIMINYHGQNRRMEINELCGKARTCAFEEKNNALHTKEAKKEA